MSSSSQDLNKVFAAILLAALIAMLSAFIARLLMPTEHEMTTVHYPVPQSEEEPKDTTAEKKPEGPEPITPLLASADPAKGQDQFRACQACHVAAEGGGHRVGPNLWNVVMSDIARHDDFNYSSTLSDMEGAWTYARLNQFIANPQGYAPGTRMTYGGLKKTQDRANLIAWLRTQSNDPAPLPEVGDASVEGTESTQAGATERDNGQAAAGGEGIQQPAETGQSDVAETGGTETGGTETAGGVTTETAGDRPSEASGTAGTETGATDTAGGEATETSGGGASAASETAGTETGDQSGQQAGSLSPLEQRLVSADAEAGKSEFRACQACHVNDQSGRHRIGPNLRDVVMSDIARHDDFRYSSALSSKEGVWTYEKLDSFIQNPRGFAPGTRMTFGGLKDDQARANLIAWLRTQSDNPAPLP